MGWLPGRGWMVVLLLSVGCSFGPRALEHDRLRYNEAVLRTSEEQLLLNIVRLRYTVTPSSLAITNVATQKEWAHSLKLIPFFTAGGDVAPRGFTSVLPQGEANRIDRPTVTFTPLDDQEFTRKLFTPLPLEGIVYLSKTTWPISTVFRLWLENLNWVSNAETASGPTPRHAPEFAEFLSGIEALQRLQDRGLINFFVEERDEKVAEGIRPKTLTAKAHLEAAKANFEYKKDDKAETWHLSRKKKQPVLRLAPDCLADADVLTFVQAFHLKPGLSSYELHTDKLEPFRVNAPPGGLDYLDLESRSLLQVLFFLANGVEAPPKHLASGLAPVTCAADGQPFDWQAVLRGLFRVCSSSDRHPPKNAAVAVRFQGHWFWIDERDRDTRATFTLMLELSRLELSGKEARAPLLTLPLGGR